MKSTFKFTFFRSENFKAEFPKPINLIIITLTLLDIRALGLIQPMLSIFSKFSNQVQTD